MIPTFNPTYKKYEDREYVELYDLNNWLHKTYRTRYKVPWYKSVSGPKI